MPASGKIVLDTSVAVRHVRGMEDVDQLGLQFETLCLPMVALGELFYGAYKSDRTEKNLELLDHWVSGVTVITLTQETARQYALIRNRLRIAGTPIPENDIWVAAHAMELDVELASYDSHFGQIDGLRLHRW